ncbi:MAG: hypothetical protein ACP5K5_03905 [Candidatus Micrarchaeia archaeon]
MPINKLRGNEPVNPDIQEKLEKDGKGIYFDPQTGYRTSMDKWKIENINIRETIKNELYSKIFTKDVNAHFSAILSNAQNLINSLGYEEWDLDAQGVIHAIKSAERSLGYVAENVILLMFPSYYDTNFKNKIETEEWKNMYNRVNQLIEKESEELRKILQNADNNFSRELEEIRQNENNNVYWFFNLNVSREEFNKTFTEYWKEINEFIDTFNSKVRKEIEGKETDKQLFKELKRS